MDANISDDGAGMADQPAVAGQPRARPAILLVDDDDRNLTALTEVLSQLDADIVCARSGREALRLVLSHDFCAILMDARMPDMDGYETATLIRQRQKSRSIPLIFLTAYDKEEAQVFRGYSTGAVDYVFKPIEPIVLRAKLSVFIELRRQSDEIRCKAHRERQLLDENLAAHAERIEAEQRVRSTERREALVMQSLPIALYEADPGQATVRTFLRNDNVKRLLGFDPERFSEECDLWSDRIHEEDRKDVLGVLRAVSEGQNYSVEYRWCCGDGAYRYFLDQGVIVRFEESGRPKMFGTMFDVHERRLLEQQVVHAQKLDAVGKLTSGIVHDFNNMLMVVIGNLDRLRRTEGFDVRTERRIGMALQGALRCRDIIKRLLGFARHQAFAPQLTTLNDLIEGMADLFKRTLGERIDIHQELSPDLWPVLVDRGQVEAAIANLLVNARDAMPDGGRVCIRTANLTVEQKNTVLPAAAPAGACVVLEVADAGHGMPEEVLRRACEPFFTTKGAGKGTGLGLSTIREFSRRSGGDLVIDSVPGNGTKVRIFLPRHNSPLHPTLMAGSQNTDATLPRARGGEVVLLVEDDESVRQTSVSTLQELGYHVLEAPTAEAALATIEQIGDIRLLFTDLVLPGLNGYELAREAQCRRNDLKVLFTSAYRGDVVAEPNERGIEPFLLKPYRDYELAHAVREALG